MTSGASEVAVVSPGPSTVFEAGKTHSICWACDKPDALLKLELYAHDRLVCTLSANSANMGIHRWLVPATIPSGSTYSIFIADNKNPALWGRSAPFAIRNRAEAHRPSTVPAAALSNSMLSGPSEAPVLPRPSETPGLPGPSEAPGLPRPSEAPGFPGPPGLPGAPGLPGRAPQSPVNSMALVEQLLREADQRGNHSSGSSGSSGGRSGKRSRSSPLPLASYISTANEDAAPSAPSAPAAQPSQPQSKRAHFPVRQFQARPQSSRAHGVSTNGPPVSLSQSEVRRCLYQMLNEPDIYADYTLANGDTVGQFAVKYILMHAQKREKKSEKKKRKPPRKGAAPE